MHVALEQAEEGDTILLAGGVHTGSGEAVMETARSATLQGGWDGASSGDVTFDMAAHPSIIDGEGQRRGVLISEGITVSLDGLSVTNGANSAAGAGLYARDSNVELRNTSFCSNVVSGADRTHGGRAMVEGGTLRAERCVFRANNAARVQYPFGGALVTSGSLNVLVTECLFLDNDANTASALYFRADEGDAPAVRIFRTRFEGNGHGRSEGPGRGAYAAALHVQGAEVELRGNTLTDNWGLSGRGTASFSHGSLLMTENTVAGNELGADPGIYCQSV